MNKIEKMAAKDAHEYGLAQMFFGQGAGTRRKLIEAVIEERIATVPGYEVALDTAYSKLSQIEMAEKAIAERKKIDGIAKAGKNLRALKRGRLQDLSTGVYVAVGVAYVAHATGYDKKAWVEAQMLYAKAKARLRKGEVVINQYFQNNDGTA